MSTLVWLASNAIYFFDRIQYNYDWFIGTKRSCMIQCIDDSGDITYKMVTFMRKSLLVFYAMNNETDYSWSNLEYKFKKLGYNIQPGDKFDTLFGDISIIKYDCPIFGPKLVFKDTSIFVEK